MIMNLKKLYVFESQRIYLRVDSKWDLSCQIKLKCLFLFQDETRDTSPFSAIDAMSNLMQLHLFYLNHYRLPCNLSILHQLEQFTLVSYIGDIMPLISQLGPNCQKLWIGYVDCTSDQWSLIFTHLNSELSQSLTHLTVGLNRPPPYQNDRYKADVQRILRLICDQCQQLDYFDVRFSCDVSI